MQCQKCTYQWMPRKQQPKECPRCKTRLDYPQLHELQPQIAVGAMQ